MNGRILTLVAAIALSTSAVAVEKNSRYKITTGSPTGTYQKVGMNLARMVEGGFVENSKGALENIQRVADGSHQAGITQLDVYAWFQSKFPSKADKVEVLGPLYKECVYIAVNKDGKVSDEDDLGKEGVTIAVGKKGSGSAVTWDYMRQLETSYKKAKVEFKGGIRALGQLASSTDSGIDAVLWTIKPSMDGKALNTVLKNENLELISVDDASLNNTFKKLGRPVYDFQKVEVEKGFLLDTEVKTICFDAVLIANSDTDEYLLDEMADAVLNYKETLLKFKP